MSAEEKTAIWPKYLMLRDTTVYADEGQRIFTTATGHGYARQEYVRADIAEGLLAACQSWLDEVEGTYPFESLAPTRAAIAAATGQQP